MGTVFLAERADGQFQHRVAIKVLRGLPSQDAKRRFRQERQILAELEHPGIARLVDGGETAEGLPWLAMEFVEGETLYAFVAKHGLDVSARVQLVQRVAEAVAHAHQRLVIHRDLKPSNVLVTADGTPKLLDFGVARLMDEADETSTRVFTPGYAPPEQLSGGRVTTRSDVYALGVMLSELLTGVAHDADLRGIALKARAEEPEGRYVTVDAFLDDLSRWREGLPVRALPNTTAYRLRRFVGRHRTALLLGVVALVAVVAFVVRLQLETQRAQRAEADAVEAKTRAEQQTKRSQRLLDFLTQTFDAAAPDNAKGKPMSAVELIADAEARLDATAPTEELADVEMMLADLSSRLGETERSLKLSERALSHLPPITDRASALRNVELWRVRSMVLNQSADYEQSLAAAKTAATLAKQHVPDDAAALAATTLRVGNALAALGDPTAREVLEPFLREQPLPGADPLAPIDASRALCELALDQEDGERALEESKRLQRLLEGLSPTHPLRVWGPQHEARALQLLGRPAEALPVMREALARQQLIYGDQGAAAASIHNDLSVILNDLGRLREATEELLRAHELGLAVGATGTALFIDDINLAVFLESAGDYPRAEATARAAFAATKDIPDQFRVQAESNLARLVAQQGRFDEARAQYERLITAAKTETASGPFVGSNTIRLAELELWAGRPAEARRVLAREPKLVELVPERALFYLRRLEARLDAAEGKLDQAVPGLRALEAEATKTFGDGSFDQAMLRVDLADALAKQGDARGARTKLDQALPVLREAVLPTERIRARAEALDKVVAR
ncbi:MAG: protein kinase domain-containing protein [Myxococcota bacterium]